MIDKLMHFMEQRYITRGYCDGGSISLKCLDQDINNNNTRITRELLYNAMAKKIIQVRHGDGATWELSDLKKRELIKLHDLRKQWANKLPECEFINEIELTLTESIDVSIFEDIEIKYKKRKRK